MADHPTNRKIAALAELPAEPVKRVRVPGPKSRFHGIYFHKYDRKWSALIYVPGLGSQYGGLSADEETAARLYDRKARELLGSAARLNFPDEALPPEFAADDVTPIVARSPTSPVVAFEVLGPEVQAIAAIAAAMAALEPSARRRVLDWANARFAPETSSCRRPDS